MDAAEQLRIDDVDLDALRAALREAGAGFAFLHGSRVWGSARPDSDLDVAAWFPPEARWWTAEVPFGVDLSSLAALPLAVAGRIALHGVLFLDDDPVARVRWVATTRARYLDEAPRRAAFVADVLAAADG